MVVSDKDAQTVEGQESRELIDDLLSAGVSHEVHEVEGSILLLGSRVALFERMLDFFAKNLK